LPISSSGHLILIPWLLGWSVNPLTFYVSLHLGTADAVLLYFWQDWIALVRAVVLGLLNPSERRKPAWRLAWMIVLGSIPAAVAGAALESTIETAVRQPWIVAILLIVFGLLLGYADRVARHARDLDSFTLREAVLVGCAQALALFPGVSRSGSTLTAGLLLGLNRESAARFSFLLSMPVILGAVLLEAFKLVRAGELQGQGPVMGVGILASAVVGIAAIRFLLGYLRRNSVLLFVGYRVAAGALVLLVSLLHLR
jgi:undecaprenyl-diphosphatase